MEQSAILEAADRICRMEQSFDILKESLRKNPLSLQEASCKEQLRLLLEYYEGGQWLRDYELDEQGLLPWNLKRGVLAQDAVFDLLEDINPYL